MSDDEKLASLLKRDPFDIAEKVTGKFYKNDEATQGLGLLMTQSLAKEKHDTLKARGDTVFRNTIKEYVQIIEAYGFEQVLVVPFTSNYAENEALFVYAHKSKGLLLVFDTYHGETVNGGRVYYNWVPNEGEKMYNLVSSGGSYNDVWAGNHDCREALIFNLTNLDKHGKLLSRWTHRPFLWLLHYMDTRNKDYNYEKINAERIGMLPDWVQTMITPVEE